MNSIISACLSAAALLLLTGASVAADQSVPAGETTTKPGDGVLCLWALTSVASEIGKRCPGKHNPDFQPALEESVDRMDRYVAANTKWSAESIESFKRQQGGLGQDVANLCTTDGLQIYEAIRSQGAAALRASVSKAVARPGTPAWGDCL
jgi:hypothetical protein